MFYLCFMLAFLSEYGLVDAPTTRITAIFCHRVICVLVYFIECQTRRKRLRWDRFMKRNPSLRLRCGDSTAGVRMEAVNTENINDYFDLLQDVFEKETTQKQIIIWMKQGCP